MPRLNGYAIPRNLSPEVFEALKTTIDYLWEAELDAYQQAYNDGCSESGLETFEFENLVVLNNWLHDKKDKASEFLVKEPLNHSPRRSAFHCDCNDNCPPSPSRSR